MALALQTGDSRPLVSVILPTYRSQDTVDRCLQLLRQQRCADYEVIVVDSSPEEACAALVRANHPEVRLIRSEQRLLPHAARNLGARQARGELLVFTDPDIYAPPDWLATLVAEHQATGAVIVGALRCHGRRWRDRGVHLVKFSKWLPFAGHREVDVSPTANMLLPRATFEAVGGFDGAQMLGDASFSWELRRRGQRLLLSSRAAVDHHHLDRVIPFLRERYRRGILYGDLRQSSGEGRGSSALARLLAVPLRLLSNLAHTARHTVAAGEAGWLLATLPLVVAGHAAALAGEAVSYWRALRAQRGLLAAARAARSR